MLFGKDDPMRNALALTFVVALSFNASANEPCSTCTNKVPRHAAAKPKVGHTHNKRYYGPVVSPNAPYGYFATNWRSWDGGASFGGCATPIVIDQSIPATPVTPAPMPNAKPETPASGKSGMNGPRSNTYAGISNLK